MKRHSLIGSALAAAVLAFSSSAGAAIISSSDNTYDFSWNYFTGSHNLTGSGTLVVTGFNSSELSIAVTLTNTAPVGGRGGDRLTAFGFGIGPNATSLAFQDNADGGFTSGGLIRNGALSSNVPGVEICAWGGPNCSGGGNGGIYAGFSDTFSFLLGGSWGDSVNIDPIGLRYQTGNGSFTFSAGNGVPVPEPGALTLLGLGLLGLAAVRRRMSTH